MSWFEQFQILAWWLLQGAGILIGLWAWNRERAKHKGLPVPKRALWTWSECKRCFLQNGTAVGASIVLVLFCLVAAFYKFLSPYTPDRSGPKHMLSPPNRLHLFDESGVFYGRPFIYGWNRSWDPVTFERLYQTNYDSIHLVHLLVRGDSYKLWGLIESDLHLFGTKGDEPIFLLGGGRLGRDLFTLLLYGARIPLALGLIGTGIALTLGFKVDGMLGYYALTFGVPYLILSESLLSSVGLGFRPPVYTWGNLLPNFFYPRVALAAPWLLVPLAAVALTTLLFVMVGRGLHYSKSGPSYAEASQSV